MLMDSRVTLRHYAPSSEDELGRVTRVLAGTEDTVARLEQRASIEANTLAFTTDRWHAAFPEGTQLEAGDEVVQGSRLFRVDGAPNAMSVPGFPVLNRLEAELIYLGPVTS